MKSITLSKKTNQNPVIPLFNISKSNSYYKVLAIKLKDIFKTVKKDVSFNPTLNLNYSNITVEYLNLFVKNKLLKVYIINDLNCSEDEVLNGLSEIGFIFNSVNLILSDNNVFNILNKDCFILSKTSIDKRLDKQTYIVPSNSDFDILHYQNLSHLLNNG